MSEQADSNSPLPISLFDYELPEELIAQRPLEDRSASRLLVLQRESEKITHTDFWSIEDWLQPGDLLVLNNTRVLPARLFAQRATGGRIEILLLQDLGNDRWSAMARPSRRLREGERVRVIDQEDESTNFEIEICQRMEDGTLVVHIPHANEILEKAGRVPLPTYISEPLSDPERYQTIFATEIGSVAAPTAGLHFTDEILDRLRERGIEIAWVTLHVGPGTFQPVKSDDVRQHQMHPEWYVVGKETLRQVRKAKSKGRRVIAVGTTSCRTLESISSHLDQTEAMAGNTSLYITPGYEFKIVDGLLTNFHLPKSTLLLLVSTLAGRELVLRSYAEAIEWRYRFYSFGDAMLIV